MKKINKSVSVLLCLVMALSCFSFFAFAEDEEPACEHEYQVTVVQPTCMEQGYQLHVCPKCGDHFQDNYIPALGHNYGEWAQVSLWSGSSSLWDEYVAFLLNDLKDEQPEFLTKFIAGQYPGALLKGTNSHGSYLYGEIMINAYSYGFYFYLLNEDDSVNSNLTQEEIELFQSILETFSPISSAK